MKSWMMLGVARTVVRLSPREGRTVGAGSREEKEILTLHFCDYNYLILATKICLKKVTLTITNILNVVVKCLLYYSEVRNCKT